MTNTNVRGGSPARRRSRERMIVRYAADVDLVTWDEWVDLLGAFQQPVFGSGFREATRELAPATFGTPEGWVAVVKGLGRPACRCYRCGRLLVFDTATRDRIVPGAKGGAYVDPNIRPACSPCQTITGNELKAEMVAARKREAERRATTYAAGRAAVLARAGLSACGESLRA